MMNELVRDAPREGIREALRRKARGFWPCIGFGTVFGAGSGASFGVALMGGTALVSGEPMALIALAPAGEIEF